MKVHSKYIVKKLHKKTKNKIKKFTSTPIHAQLNLEKKKKRKKYIIKAIRIPIAFPPQTTQTHKTNKKKKALHFVAVHDFPRSKRKKAYEQKKALFYVPFRKVAAEERKKEKANNYSSTCFP